MEYKISEIASIFTGYQNRKAIENEASGSHFLLQIRDLNGRRTAVDTNGMIRFSPSSPGKEQTLQAGDVLVLARGQKNFGFALGDLPHPTLASSYFFVLRPNETITGAYLAWYLNQPAAQRHFKRLATTGAHMPVVNRDVLESLKLPVPDREAQLKIIELEALAATQTKLLADLAKKKRALATGACRAIATGHIKIR